MKDTYRLSVASKTALQGISTLAQVAEVANIINEWPMDSRRLLANCVIQGLQTDFQLDTDGNEQAKQYRLFPALVQPEQTASGSSASPLWTPDQPIP